MFTKEMQRALEADGKKLRDLTGEDHGPHFIHDDVMDRAWTADLWEAIDAYVATDGQPLEKRVEAAAAVEAVVHKAERDATAIERAACIKIAADRNDFEMSCAANKEDIGSRAMLEECGRTARMIRDTIFKRNQNC